MNKLKTKSPLDYYQPESNFRDKWWKEDKREYVKKHPKLQNPKPNNYNRVAYEE